MRASSSSSTRFAGSVLMLLAIMAMYWQAGTTDIPTLLHHAFPRVAPDLGLVRLPRFVRGQDADVAVPHLAAGRPCRGADRGFGHPRRDPLEIGRLRLLALLAADVPASLGRSGAADLRDVGRCNHLHLAGRTGAGGREEAHRLFVGGAYGLRHHGIVRGDDAGRRRRHLPDDLARHRLGRAVPLRRRHLRPHAYARDRGLWRPGQPHADLRLRLHGVHAGECRAARHVRLYRRVPDADRHLPRQQLGGDAGDARHHPVGGLCAVALPQGDLRQARPSGACSTSRISAGAKW